MREIGRRGLPALSTQKTGPALGPSGGFAVGTGLLSHGAVTFCTGALSGHTAEEDKPCRSSP
jgi:hypothetical protein